MKKLALFLLLLALPSGALAQGGSTVGPTNQIACNKIGTANVASATTTSLANGVAGQAISVCGWHVTSTQATANTFQLEQGTQGGPCTTPTTFTPPFVVTSTAPSANNNAAAFYSLPSGAQLCVVTTGATVGTAIMVFYSQF